MHTRRFGSVTCPSACVFIFSVVHVKGFTMEAKRMAQKSVRLGNALLNAGAVQAARCHSEAALLRVHKVGGRYYSSIVVSRNSAQ